MQDVEHISRVRAARSTLLNKIIAAKSNVSSAEFAFKQAQRVLERAQTDLKFEEDELAAFNARHPLESHE